MMTRTSRSDSRILAEFRKAADLDTHVRVVEVDGIKVLEFRDYIPSLGEYGRGYWFPADGTILNDVVQSLLKAMNEGLR